MEKMTSLISWHPTHLLMEKSTNLRRRYFWNLPLDSSHLVFRVNLGENIVEDLQKQFTREGVEGYEIEGFIEGRLL